MKTVKAGLLAVVIGALMMGSSPSARADDKPTKAGMDAVFLQTLADGNMSEIMSGKLALKRSHDKRVRDAAKMLINGHTKALNDLYRVAKNTNTPLPTKLSAKSQQDYSKLSRLRGRAFDKAFMASQVKAHNAALDLIQKEMAKGDNSFARDYAAKWYGPISDHTSMIYNTAGYFGVPVGGSRTASRK